MCRARPRLREMILRGEEPGWLIRHSRYRRVKLETLSYPPWADKKAMRALQREAKRKSLLTGVKHVVDHVIPVDHPRVCGLSVPWNMQVTLMKTNARKSNAWCEWHGELFTEPEQFKLFHA